ncbi:hypothetical protein [Natrinema sp. SYSU A 869]|uniref:hypothetical protein n=1 Tax=Natrinema sp. SYSU A 869 TaxID=2871694 RepID=UPI001CA40A71|nr:hypothetical protein [Natrinema sp. SYSU A 869]
MSSQDRDEGGVSFTLAAEVDDWLTEEAARRGETRDERCRRLVTAAQRVATDDDLELADRDELVALRSQLEAQREEFTDLLEDVRDRVVEVKRNADGKAPAEHDHPDRPTDDDLAALRGEVTALERTVDGGFNNFGTVLEDLIAETDELADRSMLLAQAVVDLREHRDERAARQRRRAAADDLKLAANRLGIRTAMCVDCSSSVDIALLTAPECPHCASGFTDVEDRSSIFGSHRLLTGEPPALEGCVESSAESPPDAIFEAAETEAEAADDGAGTPTQPTDSGEGSR